MSPQPGRPRLAGKSKAEQTRKRAQSSSKSSRGMSRARGPGAILMPVATNGVGPSPPLLWRERLEAERQGYSNR